MSRKVADCRDFPSEKKCTLAISGEEEEVIKAATDHAVSAHGHPRSKELEAEIRRSLRVSRESEAERPQPGARNALHQGSGKEGKI